MAIQAQIYPEILGLPYGGSQDLMMDNNNNNNFLYNGCGFNDFSLFSLQQKQQQQQYLLQLQNLHQKNHHHHHHHPVSSGNAVVFLPSAKNDHHQATTTTPSTTTNDFMSMISPTFSAQLENQRHEIDRYISLQNERLKLELQEQRKHQMETIAKKLEAKAMLLLRQKDEEMVKARKRTMELEEIMRKMELENQAWQKVAAENEAMVLSLNNTLEQLKEQACCMTSSSNGVEDAESCCDVNHNNRGRNEEETGESRGGERERRERKKKMVCKVCNSRNSCVLFFPCRHLCSCKACEAFLDACPLCKSPKMASYEALIS